MLPISYKNNCNQETLLYQNCLNLNLVHYLEWCSLNIKKIVNLKLNMYENKIVFI